MSRRDGGRGDLVQSAAGRKAPALRTLKHPNRTSTGGNDLEKDHDPGKDRETGLTRNRK
jgi:hypothetical protein